MRYGNKGVISAIREDYEMPRIRTGEHTTEQVDIIFNTLGVFNRLNIFQLYEQSITFITDNIVRYMETMDFKTQYKEMEEMFFKVIGIFNKDQKETSRNAYKEMCKTKAQKKDFFNEVIKHGIFITIKPFWHKENLYDAIKQCYAEFPWIKPYEVFFFDTTSNRWVKQINRQIVGRMYVMVLKQNSKKGLSVCATAPINKKGVPEKTDSAKRHKSIVQHTPVRSGIQETINNIVSVSNYDLAKLHMLYRSSPIGRRELGKTIINNYGMNKPIEVEMTDKMTNRNIEILGAYLKIMGLELVEENDDIYMPDNTDSDNKLTSHIFKGSTYIATPLEMRRIVAKDLAKRQLNSGEYIVIGADSMEVDRFLDELTDRIEVEIQEEGPQHYIPRKYNEEY